VFYCKNSREFSAALDAALKDTEALKTKRLEIAADNTWEHRARQIKELLAANLERKQDVV
jgi:teichuronic acid biosynthesis glycosyltransferase TuaH